MLTASVAVEAGATFTAAQSRTQNLHSNQSNQVCAIRLAWRSSRSLSMFRNQEGHIGRMMGEGRGHRAGAGILDGLRPWLKGGQTLF